MKYTLVNSEVKSKKNTTNICETICDKSDDWTGDVLVNSGPPVKSLSQWFQNTSLLMLRHTNIVTLSMVSTCFKSSGFYRGLCKKKDEIGY